jgi:hypothetical protein
MRVGQNAGPRISGPFRRTFCGSISLSCTFGWFQSLINFVDSTWNCVLSQQREAWLSAITKGLKSVAALLWIAFLLLNVPVYSWCALP